MLLEFTERSRRILWTGFCWRREGSVPGFSDAGSLRSLLSLQLPVGFLFSMAVLFHPTIFSMCLLHFLAMTLTSFQANRTFLTMVQQSCLLILRTYNLSRLRKPLIDAHFKSSCKLLLPFSVSILVCFSVRLLLFEERDKSNSISSFLKNV